MPPKKVLSSDPLPIESSLMVPEECSESILIIHHYPTFSGGLVLQPGLARSSGGPHFPAARASITHRWLHHKSGPTVAHTLQPPRFLMCVFATFFCCCRHAKLAALTPGRLWVAARLCQQHVHRCLIYLATNCCHRTNNFLRDL